MTSKQKYNSIMANIYLIPYQHRMNQKIGLIIKHKNAYQFIESENPVFISFCDLLYWSLMLLHFIITDDLPWSNTEMLTEIHWFIFPTWNLIYLPSNRNLFFCTVTNIIGSASHLTKKRKVLPFLEFLTLWILKKEISFSW